jgi:hypothetical protein
MVAPHNIRRYATCIFREIEVLMFTERNLENDGFLWPGDYIFLYSNSYARLVMRTFVTSKRHTRLLFASVYKFTSHRTSRLLCKYFLIIGAGF